MAVRPVPSRPPSPVDPAEAVRHVTSELSPLDASAAEAFALIALAGRPREEVAGDAGLSGEALADALARARKALRRRLYPLPGSGWCERAERLISDRLDDALEDPGPARLEVHLANCSRCVEHERRLVQAQDALVAGFVKSTSEPPSAPEAEAQPADEAGPETPQEPPAVPPAALRIVDAASITQPQTTALPEADEPPALPEPDEPAALPEPDEPAAIDDTVPEDAPAIEEPDAPAIEEPDTTPAIEEPDTPPAIDEPHTPPAIEEPDTPPAIEEPHTPPAIAAADAPAIDTAAPEERQTGEVVQLPSRPPAPAPPPTPATFERPRPAPAAPRPYVPATSPPPSPARSRIAATYAVGPREAGSPDDENWAAIGPLLAILAFAILLAVFSVLAVGI